MSNANILNSNITEQYSMVETIPLDFGKKALGHKDKIGLYFLTLSERPLFPNAIYLSYAGHLLNASPCYLDHVCLQSLSLSLLQESS